MVELKKRNLVLFKGKMIKEGKWQVTENANGIWNHMAKHVKSS